MWSAIVRIGGQKRKRRWREREKVSTVRQGEENNGTASGDGAGRINEKEERAAKAAR